MKSWIDEELGGCEFVDERLEKRFRTLVERLSGGPGETIPMACQDWANTKAAYRFFSNERVSEENILSGHFQSTADRFKAADGLALVLHDTTEYSYRREKPELIGKTHRVSGCKQADGRKQMHTVCGVLMHSSLTVTTEGLPLGIAAIKFWTRDQFKGCNALKRKVNPTRVPIEEKESIRWLENMKRATDLLGDPARCVHVGDREADIFEFFHAAHALGTHFLVRTAHDRIAGDGEHQVSDEMDEVRLQGVHRIEVRDRHGKPSEAVLEIRYRQIRILPSVGKQKRYPPLMLTVIYALERGNPKDRDRIEWKLVTDLPVTSKAEAIEKLQWYALRWKIEIYHKILKSGCRAEDSKLRTAERLVRLISVFCILAWRVFWMTMMNRSAEPAPASAVFTSLERQILDRLVTDKKTATDERQKPLSSYLTKVARLGGYLDRVMDSPPGNTVMWRGLSRLTDIMLGVTIAQDTCG